MIENTPLSKTFGNLWKTQKTQKLCAKGYPQACQKKMANEKKGKK
jgi:hypothetical protein